MLAPHPFNIMPSETASVTPDFSIRRATIHDLDDIVDIALAAMPLDPQWNWRFPHRDKFPEDERHFTLLKFKEFITSRDRWLVMVAETDINYVRIPIAFAVWDLENIYASIRTPVIAQDSVSKESSRERRDADRRRMQVWTKTTSLAKKRLFDRRYGLRYIQLQVLATAPQWHRKGAATALCTRGLQLAKMLHSSVVVFASPMGKHVYSSLGFRQLAIVNVRADSDDDGVDLVAMSFSQFP
ncbi:uncharacterized protein PV09_04464 [Verruconis gallopava]|uniref:N-acetyltransferase domain-containing protein n=1 Tax=Verruconis gallopava TaxID=253628 RepID=A0A0D2ACU3_9PEZI|nr:uncharacterized protein PV09_04464 [Verruconis gallopava]KIW04733.1 hypothetical protein PV09_04464 [Verruconis gallopava]